MTHEAQAILKKCVRTYKTPTTKDAYTRGFERGYNAASWQDLPAIGEVAWTMDGNVTVDEDNQWDCVRDSAYDGESNGRDFSPFEFTASEFNKARNSEARWEAFDAGIADGIGANIQERMAAYSR